MIYKTRVSHGDSFEMIRKNKHATENAKNRWYEAELQLARLAAVGPHHTPSPSCARVVKRLRWKVIQADRHTIPSAARPPPVLARQSLLRCRRRRPGDRLGWPLIGCSVPRLLPASAGSREPWPRCADRGSLRSVRIRSPPSSVGS